MLPLIGICMHVHNFRQFFLYMIICHRLCYVNPVGVIIGMTDQTLFRASMAR